MSAVRLLPYAGPDDLAAMKALTRAAWRARGPWVECLPGDLDWRLHRYPCDPEHHIVLAWDGPELCGFAWRFGVRSEVDLVLGAEVDDRAVQLLVEWSEAVEEGAPPASIYALAQHTALSERLAARGFLPSDTAYLHFRQDLAAPAAPSTWPAGYGPRALAELGPAALAARAALHRATFGSTRVTDANYACVSEADGYRAALDLVAVAADGALAAFVLVWLDPELGVALCEPVGTHPEHRGRGLAKALLGEACARARAAGAGALIVNAFGGDPVAPALYRSAGFDLVGHNVAHRQPPAG